MKNEEFIKTHLTALSKSMEDECLYDYSDHINYMLKKIKSESTKNEKLSAGIQKNQKKKSD
jgi:transcriptional regulatory protein LevR|tara:strand:+ start:304 stop:486 length:183 start_codon:yes stop_codon:yes gene_type:complete